MKKNIHKHVFIVSVLLVVIALFYKTFLFGYLPIPSDTIIGLYHPYRDLYATDYPNGIPFKNFLITDPVRQIIPWKMLVMDSWRQFELPLWNPYEMTGKPLLANFQSGALYPLNILLIGKNFIAGWTVFILLQQLLTAVFFYWYARNCNLKPYASAFGALTFVFSGFFIAWLEWGNIIHTALWLPLILLSVDKIFNRIKNNELRIKDLMLIKWIVVYMVAIVSSFFAGHLQTFFYLFVFSSIYFLARWFQSGKEKSIFALFIILNSLFILLTSIQWIPTLQYILLSARQTDQMYLQTEGWFIPFRHLIQFIAPDFFGNPTTLNYWGTWNYGELVGYVGVIPLVFALLAMIYKKGKKMLFFTVILFISLLFAVESPIAELPYKYGVPFLSTAQPTRLLFITVFSLAILAAYGLDYFMQSIKKDRRAFYKLYSVLFIYGAVLLVLWVLVMIQVPWLGAESAGDFIVARKNLLFPTALFALGACVTFFSHVFLNKRFKYIIPFLLIGIAALDLLRFGNKFLPFTPPEYLFPQTQTTAFLEKQQEPSRILSLNSEILPPNFSTVYKLSSVEGYDPLYTQWYGMYISALERGEGNTDSLVRFNRIISPRRVTAEQLHFLNVEYILSFSESAPDNLEKVFEEGETIVYKNNSAFPRAFFVPNVNSYTTNNKQLAALFMHDLSRSAIVGPDVKSSQYATGSATIKEYSENRIEIVTENAQKGYLVLSDAYYPTWVASINGSQTPIYRTNYAFRGVVVPAGKQTVIFENRLFGF